MKIDVIKSALPPKENYELAEDLLARFPDVDRAELLKDMLASCFFDMRHGNKREERAACDFLNEVQRLALRRAQKQMDADLHQEMSSNAPAHRPGREQEKS